MWKALLSPWQVSEAWSSALGHAGLSGSRLGGPDLDPGPYNPKAWGGAGSSSPSGPHLQALRSPQGGWDVKTEGREARRLRGVDARVWDSEGRGLRHTSLQSPETFPRGSGMPASPSAFLPRIPKLAQVLSRGHPPGAGPAPPPGQAALNKPHSASRPTRGGGSGRVPGRASRPPWQVK